MSMHINICCNRQNLANHLTCYTASTGMNAMKHLRLTSLQQKQRMLYLTGKKTARRVDPTRFRNGDVSKQMLIESMKDLQSGGMEFVEA